MSNKYNPILVASKIEKLCRDKKITMRDLFEKLLGIPKENADVAMEDVCDAISANDLFLIADFFGVSLDYFRTNIDVKKLTEEPYTFSDYSSMISNYIVSLTANGVLCWVKTIVISHHIIDNNESSMSVTEFVATIEDCKGAKTFKSTAISKVMIIVVGGHVVDNIYVRHKDDSKWDSIHIDMNDANRIIDEVRDYCTEVCLSTHFFTPESVIEDLLGTFESVVSDVIDYMDVDIKEISSDNEKEES